MASVDEIDVDASVDIDKRDLYLERNFRIIKELIAAPVVVPLPEARHVVGAAGEIAFLNGWSNAGGAFEDTSYYLHNNRVHVVGLVNSGTVSTPMFTLPVGYRPSGSSRSFCFYIGSGVTTIEVRANGDVLTFVASSSMSLNFSFRIA